MTPSWHMEDALRTAAAIDAEIRALTIQDTPHIRTVRRKYSRLLKGAPATFMLQLARSLCKTDAYRWLAYELVGGHRGAFERLRSRDLERLGQGINNWWTVDPFARTLSGPAWLHRQVTDGLFLKWARSDDRWWRRAALVSTVALNMRSQGGPGDAPRTLRLCRLLANDRDDMVVKALSWALRALAVNDAGAVQEFLDQYSGVLAARVTREVRNKLRTGLKNPRRAGRRR